jgi:hypothetical protein
VPAFEAGGEPLSGSVMKCPIVLANDFFKQNECVGVAAMQKSPI